MQTRSWSDLTVSPLRGSFSVCGSNPGLTPGATFCRSLRELVVPFSSSILLGAVILFGTSFVGVAQTNNTPFPQPTELQQGPALTNEEFVRLLYQLPARPNEVEKL